MKLAQRLSSVLLVSILLLVLGAVQPIWAHAIIRSAMPAPASEISGDTVSIKLRFNSRIDHERSTLILIAADGTQQALTILASPTDGLNAEAGALPSGSWRLRWQVLSIDGHITRGDIPFTVH